MRSASPVPTFFRWLSQQVERRDHIGVFARYAVADKVFPRKATKLHLFLLRYEGMPEQRRLAKLAHREWRKSKKESEIKECETKELEA